MVLCMLVVCQFLPGSEQTPSTMHWVLHSCFGLKWRAIEWSVASNQMQLAHESEPLVPLQTSHGLWFRVCFTYFHIDFTSYKWHQVPNLGWKCHEMPHPSGISLASTGSGTGSTSAGSGSGAGAGASKDSQRLTADAKSLKDLIAVEKFVVFCSSISFSSSCSISFSIRLQFVCPNGQMVG